MPLIRLCLLGLMLCASLGFAQSIRQATFRDLTQLEQVINLRANDFLLMGNGFLWRGLENLLRNKLARGGKVRILTGAVNAPTFVGLARAGAEVRVLPGSITQGPLLAGEMLIGQKNAYEFSVIDSVEMVGIVRARVMEMYSSGMTKLYKP
jgi:hypothetical protein